jgi:hypothetical protein
MNREALAQFLFERFATPPREWADAPEGRRELWRRYADDAMEAAEESVD